jgi:hypothetical protein
MKILALEKDRPGVTSAQCAPFLEAEARAVWSLVQSGMIREIYFREDRTLAIVLLEAASTRQAEDSLAHLPLVEAGLTEFDVIGLRAYPGFARLFAAQ